MLRKPVTEKKNTKNKQMRKMHLSADGERKSERGKTNKCKTWSMSAF